MEIIIKIKSNNNHKQKLVLLNAMVNNPEPPPGTLISVRINRPDGFVDIKYNQLMARSVFIPTIVNVIKTTNNRQLEFFTMDFRGRKSAMEPQLTIDRKPRPYKKVKYSHTDSDGHTDTWYEREYLTKWNPKIWNISDTGEQFIMDGKEIIELDILPLQEFEIVLAVKENIKIHLYCICIKFHIVCTSIFISFYRYIHITKLNNIYDFV